MLGKLDYPENVIETPRFGPMPDSPEITGDYLCLHCGNTAEFIGFGDRGNPGDDCECGQDICECQVTLASLSEC
jgi:hypothetical protein